MDWSRKWFCSCNPIWCFLWNWTCCELTKITWHLRPIAIWSLDTLLLSLMTFRRNFVQLINNNHGHIWWLLSNDIWQTFNYPLFYKQMALDSKLIIGLSQAPLHNSLQQSRNRCTSLCSAKSCLFQVDLITGFFVEPTFSNLYNIFSCKHEALVIQIMKIWHFMYFVQFCSSNFTGSWGTVDTVSLKWTNVCLLTQVGHE